MGKVTLFQYFYEKKDINEVLDMYTILTQQLPLHCSAFLWIQKVNKNNKKKIKKILGKINLYSFTPEKK